MQKKKKKKKKKKNSTTQKCKYNEHNSLNMK